MKYDTIKRIFIKKWDSHGLLSVSEYLISFTNVYPHVFFNSLPLSNIHREVRETKYDTCKLKLLNFLVHKLRKLVLSKALSEIFPVKSVHQTLGIGFSS